MKLIIGFSKAKSPLKIGSKLIQWYLKRPYSHVYLNFYSLALSRSIIYEAVGAGVRFIGLKLWSKNSVVVREYELEVSDAQMLFLRQWCIDNAGIHYGFWQNIGIVVANLFKLSKNPFRRGINCSELIAIILQQQGYYIGKPLDLVTPADIEDILAKRSSTV